MARIPCLVVAAVALRDATGDRRLTTFFSDDDDELDILAES